MFETLYPGHAGPDSRPPLAAIPPAGFSPASSKGAPAPASQGPAPVASAPERTPIADAVRAAVAMDLGDCWIVFVSDERVRSAAYRAGSSEKPSDWHEMVALRCLLGSGDWRRSAVEAVSRDVACGLLA